MYIKRFALKAGHILPVFLIFLNFVIWYWVIQYKEQLEKIAITTFQNSQMEIVRSIARSIISFTSGESARRGIEAIPEKEQEIFKKYVEPVILLKPGDEWI